MLAITLQNYQSHGNICVTRSSLVIKEKLNIDTRSLGCQIFYRKILNNIGCIWAPSQVFSDSKYNCIASRPKGDCRGYLKDISPSGVVFPEIKCSKYLNKIKSSAEIKHLQTSWDFLIFWDLAISWDLTISWIVADQRSFMVPRESEATGTSAPVWLLVEASFCIHFAGNALCPSGRMSLRKYYFADN